MKKTASLLTCFLFTAALVTGAETSQNTVDPPRLIPLDETAVETTLHVRVDAEKGGDGTKENPLDSIQSAVTAALRLKQPVRILIGPGTYRETIDIVGSPDQEQPLLILEAEKIGETIISGSDVFSDWAPVEGQEGRFQHAWPHQFGWEKNPWPGLMPLEAPGLRSELLFVDEKPLRQVSKEADLVAGTYWVNEEAGQMVMVLEPGIDPSSHRIEATVLPAKDQGPHSKLLRAQQRKNLVLRGLTFRHARSTAFSGSIQLLASDNVLIEDVRAEWNAGTGLLLAAFRGHIGENVVVRRSHFDHNGFMGASGSATDALFEDVSMNFNNWRGMEIGATGWAPCGWKLSGLNRVVLRRVQAIGNGASGGWFDDVIHHVLVEDYVGMNNYRSGLSVEAVTGPLEIQRAFLAGNSTGFNLFDSRNVTLRDSVLTDNTASQIRLAGSLPMDPEDLAAIKQDWRRARLSKRQIPTNIVLENNLIGLATPADAAFADARLIITNMRESAYQLPDGSPSMQPLFETLKAGGNGYAWNPEVNSSVFSDPASRPVDFHTWQELTGQDKTSTMEQEKVTAAQQAKEKTLGVTVAPYTAPADAVAPQSQADALEL